MATDETTPDDHEAEEAPSPGSLTDSREGESSRAERLARERAIESLH